jgi:nitrogen fixation NifU-like protein
MNADQRGLYEEVILEHNRHPRHYLKNPRGSTHHARGFNPLCDDEIQVHLKVANDTIEDIGFEGAGCAICMASASMMTEAVAGRPLDEVVSLFHRVHRMLAENGPAEGVGKLRVLEGVHEFPMRVKSRRCPGTPCRPRSNSGTKRYVPKVHRPSARNLPHTPLRHDQPHPSGQ